MSQQPGHNTSADDDLFARLGYRRYGLVWPKLEILFGLAAVGLAIVLAVRIRAADDWPMTAAALVLFVLGGYLTLAGHRSHLYKASNEQTAYLADEIKRLKGKGTLE